MSEIWRRVRAGEILASELIIDCHGHMGPWFAFHIPGDPWAAGMVAVMDACGIRQVIAAPHVGIGPDSPLGNHLIAEAARAHPGRICGYCTVNPNYPASETTEELEKHIARGNLIGIKIHPGIHMHAADGPGYRPVWEWAQAHRAPVLVHTWDGDSRCAPENFVKLTQKYTDVPIILGHSGGTGPAKLSTAETVKECPNLYLDLTGSLLPYGVLEGMVDRAGADRILFGTDMPFMDCRPQIGCVAFARIPDDDKRKILGLNARRLFRV